MPTRRAVLTGLGVLSPVGATAPAFFRALTDGAGGVRPVRAFDASGLPCRVAGEVPDFDPKAVAAKEVKKSLKVMARTVRLGVIAAQLAAEDAKLTRGAVAADRLGVEFGCVMVATELDDLAAAAQVSTTPGDPPAVDLGKWGADGLGRVTPLWMLKYLPNMPACHVSIQHDARGPNNTVTAGDAAGLLAVGEAYRLIGRDLADAFLVGGCDSRINPLSFTRFNTFAALTRRGGGPRPYDADRDGTALGEAAAVFVLEELGSARRRGAAILGEVVGFASGFDRGKKGPVFARVVRNALTEAGISPADVDHVNAAAGGFVDLDAWEARAVADVFGDRVPVFAARGHVGNCGAASGPLELAASVLALKHGELPGTLNHESADPACPVSVHVGPPRPVAKPYAVKLSFTDMGQCAAAVVRAWHG